VTTKVTIGLLASVLVVSIVSPAFGGPSLAVLDKRVKTLKKRSDRLSSQMAQMRGRVDGLTKLALVTDDVRVTVQSALLLPTSNPRFYSATVDCGFSTATGGGVSVEGGFSTGVLHTHRLPASSFSNDTGYADGETGTKVVLSRPFGNGWQGSVYHDGQFPLTARVYVMCTKLG
jgi:hypothetical protein